MIMNTCGQMQFSPPLTPSSIGAPDSFFSSFHHALHSVTYDRNAFDDLHISSPSRNDEDEEDISNFTSDAKSEQDKKAVELLEVNNGVVHASNGDHNDNSLDAFLDVALPPSLSTPFSPRKFELLLSPFKELIANPIPSSPHKNSLAADDSHENLSSVHDIPLTIVKEEIHDDSYDSAGFNLDQLISQFEDNQSFINGDNLLLSTNSLSIEDEINAYLSSSLENSNGSSKQPSKSTTPPRGLEDGDFKENIKSIKNSGITKTGIMKEISKKNRSKIKKEEDFTDSKDGIVKYFNSKSSSSSSSFLITPKKGSANENNNDDGTSSTPKSSTLNKNCTAFICCSALNHSGQLTSNNTNYSHHHSPSLNNVALDKKKKRNSYDHDYCSQLLKDRNRGSSAQLCCANCSHDKSICNGGLGGEQVPRLPACLDLKQRNMVKVCDISITTSLSSFLPISSMSGNGARIIKPSLSFNQPINLCNSIKTERNTARLNPNTLLLPNQFVSSSSESCPTVNVLVSSDSSRVFTHKLQPTSSNTNTKFVPGVSLLAFRKTPIHTQHHSSSQFILNKIDNFFPSINTSSNLNFVHTSSTPANSSLAPLSSRSSSIPHNLLYASSKRVRQNSTSLPTTQVPPSHEAPTPSIPILSNEQLGNFNVSNSNQSPLSQSINTINQTTSPIFSMITNKFKKVKSFINHV